MDNVSDQDHFHGQTAPQAFGVAGLDRAAVIIFRIATCLPETCRWKKLCTRSFGSIARRLPHATSAGMARTTSYADMGQAGVYLELSRNVSRRPPGVQHLMVVICPTAKPKHGR